MSKFRRRLMSMANTTPRSDDDTVATWEYLFSRIQRGLYIEQSNGVYRWNYDTFLAKRFITWRQIYEIIPPGVYISIEDSHEVVFKYDPDVEKYVNMYLDSLVSISDLRKIFPTPVRFGFTDTTISIIYDDSIVEEKSVIDFASLIDVYNIIPYGISIVFSDDGRLVLRKDDSIEVTYPVILDKVDPPYLSKDIEMTHPIRLRDFFEIIPSGISLSSTGEIIYSDSTDYNRGRELTYAEFFNIIPQGIKLTVNQDNTIGYTSSNMEIPNDTTQRIPLSEVQAVLPDCVVTTSYDDGTYRLKYNEIHIGWLDTNDKFVTRKLISAIIPHGLRTTMVDGRLQIDSKIKYPIGLFDLDKPITKEFVDNIIPENISMSFNDITGEIIMEY